MHRLDLKDKKLLYELDLNSRQSFNELARKLKLSKNAVIYRISNLKKGGIIKRFHTVVDIGKLGYASFRVYLKLQNTTPKKEKEIISFLKQKDMVTWLVSIEGDYHLGALILCKSVREMSLFWKELLEKYSNFIDKRLLTIMTKVSYFSRAYLLGLKSNSYELVFITEPEELNLDLVDIAILKILAPNSRIPIVELAEKIGVTPKTGINRIRNLKEKRVIIGYKTMFDLEKLGYCYFKVHIRLHNLTKEKENRFREYVKKQPNIIYDDEVLGGDDFEIEVQVRDVAELRKIIEEIKAQFAGVIKSYMIMQFYREHKYLFLPVKV